MRWKQCMQVLEAATLWVQILYRVGKESQSCFQSYCRFHIGKKNLAFSKETRKYRISTQIKLSIFQRNIFCSSVKKQGNFIIYLTLGDRYQLPKTLNATGITTKAFLRMVMIHNYLSHGFCKETIQRIFISLLSCERSELHLFNKMSQEHF